jgi:hypothetical protein
MKTASHLLFMLLGAGLALASVSAFAQVAYRCDRDGKAVYSETPCADARAVTTTQEAADQKARSEQAAAKLQRDNAAVDQKISQRADRDAKERAAMNKGSKAAKAPKTPKAKKTAKAKGKMTGTLPKAPKKAKSASVSSKKA